MVRFVSVTAASFAGLLFFVVVPSLGSHVFGAEVYRSTGEYGEPVYSDEPHPGSEKVEVPPLTIVPSIRVAPEESETPAEDEEGQSSPYDHVAIVSPKEDAAIRDNAGNVHVGLMVSPGLKAGHAIWLYVDGDPWGEPLRSTSVTLTNLSRGTHVLEAAIVDSEGQVVARSEGVSFHLRRVSKLLQKPPQTPGGATRQPSQTPGGAGNTTNPSAPGGATRQPSP